MGYYSNRLSYKEVEKLVERISGKKLLSDQKIWQIIVNKAGQVSVEWQQENEEINKIIKTDVAISSEVDIYDPDSPEILLFEELKTYFKKHESEIIDYERRPKAGKSIGSGRVEKAVDLVIGHRQKRKGMSWSSLGSKALAILKVVELNGEWQQFWFPETAI